MLVDARSLQSNEEIACDICIMGAGAAGITLARELAGTALKVCVLEGGGLDYDPQSQSLYTGQRAGYPYPELDLCRLRYFGGSTNHWAGNCTPLEPMDFEARPWVEHSGWPFERAHLDPYYERAQTYCQLGPFRYDPEFWVGRRPGEPLPLRSDRVATGIAYDSDAHFGPIYQADLEQARNVTVFLNANVVDIAAAGAGDRIAAARVVVLDGPSFQVSARCFVLAMGGIENARMLLLSNGVQASGLGNQNDLVGRFFMDHPMVEGMILRPSRPALPLAFYDGVRFNGKDGNGFGQTAFLKIAEETLRAEGLTNIRAPFVPRSRYWASAGIDSYEQIMRSLEAGEAPDDFWYHLGNVIVDIDMIAEGASRKFLDRGLVPSAYDFAFYSFRTMVEQTPNPDSRVTLTEERDALGLRKARLDWRIAGRDRENLWRCYEILGAELGRLGLGRTRLLRHREDILWGPELGWGRHHMGTTRMNRNPRFGVVDPDCRVHGLKNLFVAGSSVFPTSGHVPPTLTIVALAVRLAEHLKTIAARL